MGAAHRDTVVVIGDNITFKMKINETLLSGASLTAPTDVKFTVKRNLNDEDYLFSVDLNYGITLISGTTYEYIINVPPAYTGIAEEGNYYYNLTLYFDDSVYTIMMGIIHFVKGTQNV